MELMIFTFVLMVILFGCLCWCCQKDAHDQDHPVDRRTKTVNLPLESVSTQKLNGRVPTRQRVEVQEQSHCKEGEPETTNENVISTGQQLWRPLNTPMAMPQESQRIRSMCTSVEHIYQAICEDTDGSSICVAGARSISDLSQNNYFEQSSMRLNIEQAISSRHLPKILPPSLPDLSNPIRPTDFSNGVVRNASRIVYYENLASPDMSQSITFMQTNVTASLCQTCYKAQCKCSSN